MSVYKFEVVKKESQKISPGNYQNSFIPIGELYSSFPLPTSPQTSHTYGYDPMKTYEIYTMDDIKENSYLRANDIVYYVRLVLPFPNHKKALLEVV
ncbi:hypothetical protein [Tuberibacillus calidus]|uniref:hypothetical protein n=1 Tax=Tuberibacillus calidus TaxID=340097 RepID=UPI0012DC92CF|nr:hypothetical protein [Tuberibacillus calidus]